MNEDELTRVNDASALQSALSAVGVEATVGVAGDDLVVYTPNRYQHRRAMGATGETFNGRRVRVFRAGRSTTAAKVQP